jgi:predicted ATP-dependent endonuclease of OLD family
MGDSMQKCFTAFSLIASFVTIATHASDTEEKQLKKLKQIREDVDGHAKDLLLAAYTRPKNDTRKTQKMDHKFIEGKRQIIEKLYREEEALEARIQSRRELNQELKRMVQRKLEIKQQATLNPETQLKASKLHRRVRAKL